MKAPLSLGLTASALLFCTSLLGGCAAGPDFKEPPAPTVAAYGSEKTPAQTVETKTELGGVQRFMPGGDVPAAWWTLFQSASLNDLIERAVKASPSLEAAQAALRQAEENAKAAQSGFFPTLDGSASVERAQTSSLPGRPFTLYNTSVSVSYAPDIFGGVRRENEAAQAQAEAQKFFAEAAYLTLTSNVTTTIFQEASLRGQIAAQKNIVEAEQKQLEITRQQLAAGAVAKSAVLAQEANVATGQAALPPLENKLAQTRHLLAVLMGQFPSEEIGASFELSSFHLPADLPVTLPSKLVERRPDIRAARAKLEAANAEIGIAMAAMLPQFPLTASYGVAASHMADLFNPTTAVWGLGAGLLQPLFHGGELLHKKRAAVAAFDAAAAQYRATVLAAFKDVADSLKALETDAQRLQAQAAAESAAKENLDLSTQRFNAGAIDYVALLSAQTAYQQAKIGLIQAQAARLADTVALYQSLGGGWWQKENASLPSIEKKHD